MTDLREAAQMALDALDEACEIVGKAWAWRDEKGRPAAEAIRAALAQPEQKPVAWVYPDGFEALQNRKCWTAYGTHQNEMMRPLYAAPPQREWQGLTDEEIVEIAATPAAIPGAYVHCFARAIETKLKEKNS